MSWAGAEGVVDEGDLSGGASLIVHPLYPPSRTFADKMPDRWRQGRTEAGRDIRSKETVRESGQEAFPSLVACALKYDVGEEKARGHGAAGASLGNHG